MFRLAVHVGAVALVGASLVDDFSSLTRGKIDALHDVAVQAKARLSNTSELDEALNTIGKKFEKEFDAGSYDDLRAAYATLEKRVSRDVEAVNAATNATDAEELLDRAEAAFRNMTAASSKIDDFENSFRGQLKAAVMGKANPAIQAAKEFGKSAAILQHASHAAMDPLYGLGDAAEDVADKFNDETNDALSSVDKRVRVFTRHISDAATRVQKSVEGKVLVDQDRNAALREKNQLVRRAAVHVHELQSPAGLLSVQLGSAGGVSLLAVSSVLAASLGAFGVAVFLKKPARSSDYLILEA